MRGDPVKPKSIEERQADSLIQTLENTKIMMEAVAKKMQRSISKSNELENDIVVLMDRQNLVESRISKIETAFNKAGVPGFRTPFWKRIFRVKDHLSHLEGPRADSSNL
jgi:hypothetical protein